MRISVADVRNYGNGRASTSEVNGTLPPKARLDTFSEGPFSNGKPELLLPCKDDGSVRFVEYRMERQTRVTEQHCPLSRNFEE